MSDAVKALSLSVWDAIDEIGLEVVNVALPAMRAYMRYVPLEVGRLPIMGLLMHYHKTHQSRFVEATGPLDIRMVGDTRDEIHAAIYLCGTWEPNLTSWLLRRLRAGDAFIDLGANNGYFTLLASRLVGAEGKVVSIEAQPRTFAKLQRNVALNQCTNVRSVHVAVFDRTEVLPLYSPDLEAHPGLTSLLEAPGFAPIGTVQATTIDRVLVADELANARVIKIDIEGAEWNVLPSLVSLIPRCRPDVEIVVEITPYAGRSIGELLRPFRELGFSASLLADDVMDLILPRKLPREPVPIGKWELSERANVILSRAVTDRPSEYAGSSRSEDGFPASGLYFGGAA